MARSLVFGHCMAGHCENCPGVMRNGPKAPKPLSYCSCKKCHEPVKQRKAEHAEQPPAALPPTAFVKVDKTPKDVKAKHVRQWARARGMDVPERGRMPKHILNLYLRHLAREEAAA